MYSFFNQVQKKYQVLCTKNKVLSTKYQVGIRVLTQIVLLRDLACLPQAGYMVLSTWYLIHGSWCLVLRTKVSCFLFLGSCFTKKRLSIRSLFSFSLFFLPSSP
jgi:hypothetical protein